MTQQGGQILGGILNAANAANATAQLSSFNLVRDTFQEDENGKVTPIELTFTKTVTEEDGSTTEETIILPLLSFMNFSALLVTDLTVEMDIAITTSSSGAYGYSYSDSNESTWGYSQSTESSWRSAYTTSGSTETSVTAKIYVTGALQDQTIGLSAIMNFLGTGTST